ncbi:hypothetical protein TWF225_010849 [Orbilia oligospora]|nr:hypothetical protein TWF751_006289 [Orbilia oligospora]KAF3192989.1 hypothetical protein TWF225_010849 [Orbilia oligospora]KAF3252513.1 hypothetical protein TWF217_007709 [Orbilia oligospora]KAF3271441.1 hypothetical protein TWF128_000039 [Orbilia oligospora]KAF3292639.1 hypothetical protein TWF132_005354 [Orbilia oligospora]
MQHGCQFTLYNGPRVPDPECVNDGIVEWIAEDPDTLLYLGKEETNEYHLAFLVDISVMLCHRRLSLMMEKMAYPARRVIDGADYPIMRIMIEPGEDIGVLPLLLHIIHKPPEAPKPITFGKLKDFAGFARKYQLADAVEKLVSFWIRALIGEDESHVTKPGFEGWLFIADTFPGIDCSSRIIEKLSLVLSREICQREGAEGFQRWSQPMDGSSEANSITQIKDEDIPSCIFAHILQERKRYLFHWTCQVTAFTQCSSSSSLPPARETNHAKSMLGRSLKTLGLAEMFLSNPVSPTPTWPVWMFADRVQRITAKVHQNGLQDLKNNVKDVSNYMSGYRILDILGTQYAKLVRCRKRVLGIDIEPEEGNKRNK